MDLAELLADLRASNQISDVVNNPTSQFGTAAKPLLGGTILPEQTVPANMYREEGIKFRTFAAVPSTRYSPVTLFEGALASSFSVELGESDFGVTLDAKEFDLLRRKLGAGTMQQASQTILGFAGRINEALQLRNEIWRWQALEKSQIVAKHGNVQFTVDFANPVGHRVTVPGGNIGAPAGWYDPTYDPLPDIFAMIDRLEGKGFKISRIITSRNLLGLLSRHPKVQTRLGSIVYVQNGNGLSAQLQAGRVTSGQIVDAITSNGVTLPNGIEIYDQTYNTRTKTKRFMSENVMMFICGTGRDQTYEDIVGEDGQPLIVPDTLGYMGIGTAAGQDTAGRVVVLDAILNKKPPRIEGEGWQTSGPVILEPEAIGVLTIGKPS